MCQVCHACCSFSTNLDTISGVTEKTRKADTALPDNTTAELSDADTGAAVEAAMTGSGQKGVKGRKGAGKQSTKDNAGKATALSKEY